MSEELVEQIAPLLDDVLDEPCSYEFACKVLYALEPMFTAARIEGVKLGLEAAAKACWEAKLGAETIVIRTLSPAQIAGGSDAD